MSKLRFDSRYTKRTNVLFVKHFQVCRRFGGKHAAVNVPALLAAELQITTASGKRDPTSR